MPDRRGVHATPKRTHEPAHFVWRLPSIAVLGWIPFYSAAEYMPVCELRKQWESGDPLLGLLFQSGNPTPASSYRSVAAFWDQMKLGHFRAAFSIDELVFAFDKAGAPVLAEFETDFRVGGTPIRTAGAEVRLSGMEKPERRFGGALTPVFKWTAHSIEVRLQHHFKIGRLCELMGQLMTGSTAPFASFEVGIRVNYLGQVEVTTRSTAVPSLWLYLTDSNNDDRLRVRNKQELENFPLNTFTHFTDTNRNHTAPLMTPIVTSTKAERCNPALLRGF